MGTVITGQRLTWEQIRTAYPDEINVESAVVICGMADGDYIGQRLEFMRQGRMYEYERTEDTRGFMGVML